jgi:hypothetical protein
MRSTRHAAPSFLTALLVILMSVLYLSPAYAQGMTLGDGSGDGKVDVLDAVAALRYSVDMTPPDEIKTSALDVDKSGAVDVGDVVHLLRYAAGVTDRFPRSGVPSLPLRLTAVAGDGQVRLSWAEPLFPGEQGVWNYIIYKLSGGNEFTVSLHPASSATSVTFKGLSNKTSYRFRVFATNPSGEGAPSRVVAGIPGTLPPATPIRHVLSTGQSLAVGYGGGPALSVTQPYQNLAWGLAGFVPLTETRNETMSSGMANSVARQLPGTPYQMLVTVNGVLGATYQELKKGTVPYADSLQQVIKARDEALLAGRPYVVDAMTVVHGESDYFAHTGTKYEAYLAEWQRDFERDVRAITGQVQDVPLLTDQMSSMTFDSAISSITLSQLSAAERHPGKVVLVGPKYQFDYVDPTHLRNTSYRWLGEYYGKVYKKVLIDKQPWTPLRPKTVWREGKVIRASFHVPVPPLVLDTKRVQSTPHYGFEYTDDSPNPPAIEKVELVSGDTVEITLDAVPQGDNPRLRYAYKGVPGAWPGASAPGSARGNLRDSDLTPSLYGNDLSNWCVHFDKPIPFETP